MEGINKNYRLKEEFSFMLMIEMPSAENIYRILLK
ncbi:Uncharacterised protein [Clostridium paraputrificum]|uniref:Uncharacterized protein n=1 Tax=Clostridium paraputrificum TaxID=29363 RepID=A0A6N3BSD8_9CLOT